MLITPHNFCIETKSHMTLGGVLMMNKGEVTMVLKT